MPDCTIQPRATYDAMKRALESLLRDMSVLAGERVGPSDSAWQDVALTACTSARVLADQLDQARQGRCESGITFPSPSEACDAIGLHLGD